MYLYRAFVVLHHSPSKFGTQRSSGQSFISGKKFSRLILTVTLATWGHSIRRPTMRSKFETPKLPARCENLSMRLVSTEALHPNDTLKKKQRNRQKLDIQL